jgi:GrpB-like predicted nucleotidyltransferase (UPF0157 family)
VAAVPDDALAARLRLAGVDPVAPLRAEPDPWQIWLRLRKHCGQRATLLDLYLLEAIRQGVPPEALPAPDRARLTAAALPVIYPGADSIPGTERPAEPIEITRYDPAWPRRFSRWRDRLATALGSAALRIEHVGSTSVPGLAAKPVIDVQVSVADLRDEESYVPRCESAGLVLRLLDHEHRFFRPPAGVTRDVHVHVCTARGEWERAHLLLRDYLRAHPAARDGYAAIKQRLAVRWAADRIAYTEAKTGFILDTLDDAEQWAARASWQP